MKEYKKTFLEGDLEKKKGLLRSSITLAVLDGDTLKINPSYVSITGVSWHPQGEETPVRIRKHKK
ncbi:MAG: hypothetical protein AUK35_08465 [Zetaproteobacteria bacterium CG2_30_46_52]|nr:MAG: hypothetical protein AUK35_08465 [Zetaproteobacteria bacterium CG2_30_46_52]